ncbi:killer toxin subunits alpha beta [Colletotrichum chrysophilum]|uniref:Killer toxin subunits alpha beta n=1 Tax=Colletotrichum chrysophilum TaxID=1836956 RepID=A0AAD9AM34_9PEZI|nr:killer toxin subunits alpha beta [Colletotrichum chrysophilum]
MIVRKTMKAADKPELRILPLGASIVFGVGSSTGNGFRKPLRDALRYDGFEVNMVGTRHNATSGAIVSEIRSYLKGSLAYKPNVVVINGGTNDSDATGALNRITANQQYRLLAEQLAASGKCIYMADMDPDEPNIAHNWIALEADIGGHKKMASVFYDAIMKAVSDDKIKNPAAMAKTGTTGCDKTLGGTWTVAITATKSMFENCILTKLHAASHENV